MNGLKKFIIIIIKTISNTSQSERSLYKTISKLNLSKYLYYYNYHYHHIIIIIIIYHYLSLFIIIYHYLSLFIIIYHYLSLFIIIYHYLSLFITIYHYLSLCLGNGSVPVFFLKQAKTTSYTCCLRDQSWSNPELLHYK